MKILHLETSSKNCSVAISDGENLPCLCEEVSEGYKQSESLHTFIEWALEGAEISLKELDAICLGAGPGSYTGLRIGAASAKGFCFGLNIPLLSVDSLISMATPFFGAEYDLIIPMVDARRDEVYTATFDRVGERIEETRSLILTEEAFNDFAGKKILFCGDGAAKAEKILNSNADFDAKVYPSAQHLVSTAVNKYKAGNFENIAYYQPLYLKEFQGVKKS